MIWHAAGSSLLLLREDPMLSALVLVAVIPSCSCVDTVSGCRVAEWMPYACRHSLTVRAFSRKLDMDSSETTTWADAMAFCWSRRQMCSSWTDSIPGIYAKPKGKGP